ncbi:MAG: hypothetical protein O2862_06660 [Bacteroidetes bacterium]|nr:hypothetical protein [Bacteroidota bacterium]
MKPLQLTLIALIASLAATAQLAQKFNLALTTKNVWLSPTLTYKVSPTASLELTLPLNSTLFLDDALGGLGIYSFYSKLKYVRTLTRRANLHVFPLLILFHGDTRSFSTPSTLLSPGFGIGKTFHIGPLSIRPEFELSLTRDLYSTSGGLGPGASWINDYIYGAWPSFGITVMR